MNVFVETKTNEEKDIYKDILDKVILSHKRVRKGKKSCSGLSHVATMQL